MEPHASAMLPWPARASFVTPVTGLAVLVIFLVVAIIVFVILALVFVIVVFVVIFCLTRIKPGWVCCHDRRASGINRANPGSLASQRGRRPVL